MANKMYYALWEIANREVIVSAEEALYIERYIQQLKEGVESEPQKALIEDGKRFIAYGCVFVNKHAELDGFEQLQAELAKWKGYGFAHIDLNGNVYFAELEDFRLYPEKQNNHFPVALLLKDSALPLSEKREQVLTLFLYLHNLSTADNLVNRDYLLPLKYVKELSAESALNWETEIDDKLLLRASAKIR